MTVTPGDPPELLGDVAGERHERRAELVASAAAAANWPRLSDVAGEHRAACFEPGRVRNASAAERVEVAAAALGELLERMVGASAAAAIAAERVTSAFEVAGRGTPRADREPSG